MAFVSKRGKTYCLRYRYEDELGRIREKRVSGFKTKEDAWAAARDLEAKSSAGIDVHGDAMTCEELMHGTGLHKHLTNVLSIVKLHV